MLSVLHAHLEAGNQMHVSSCEWATRGTPEAADSERVAGMPPRLQWRNATSRRSSSSPQPSLHIATFGPQVVRT